MDETWILQRFLARDEEGLAAAYAQLGPGLTALAARIARSRSVSGRSFWRGIFTPCR